MRRGKARSNQFPPGLIRRADFPEFCGPTSLDLLTENQRALPVFWKRPLSLVGRQGLEPWTR